MKKAANVKHRVFFLVPQEVQLLDVTGPVHLFYEANEYGANIATYFLALENKKEALSSAGLSLGPLEHFTSFELNENDILIIPGFESRIFFAEDFSIKNEGFFVWLKRQSQNSAKICSICTGTYLLAFGGLCDKKNCATHWKYFEDFQERFPKAKLQTDRLFVKDGNLYSSAGVSSGIDLSLFLLEELLGPVFATKIAKEVVIYLRRTENDPQLSVFLQYRNHIENRVHQVQDLLAQQLAEKKSIEELAEKVHMSPRNLTRLFKKTTGITIGSYVEKLRVEKALQLLSQNEKVSSVAKACGLNSSNQLRSLLKKYQTNPFSTII
ncbi:AraC family transcriptional regulator [uncultured Croceitalea sp.]|uniref:GlxA family transcriptional regulator n=1 Tax=uncultured Croceitalea sp. TaxID=1798908 RepID=UPI003305767A